jgi:exosortase K
MTRGDLLAIVVTLAVAYAVKRHYSVDPVDRLDWILRPTAALVGSDFERVPGEGYLSRDRHFLIAKACAGVNFLVVAFCAPVLGFVTGVRRKALLVAGAAAAAYVATVLVNAVRIGIAVHLPAAAHQVEGVIVYTVGLCLFWVAARRVLA